MLLPVNAFAILPHVNASLQQSLTCMRCNATLPSNSPKMTKFRLMHRCFRFAAAYGYVFSVRGTDGDPGSAVEVVSETPGLEPLKVGSDT